MIMRDTAIYLFQPFHSGGLVGATAIAVHNYKQLHSADVP